MRTKRGLFSVIAALAAAVTLTGCSIIGGSEDPIVEGNSPPTPTPSSSPTHLPPLPDLPETATQKTIEGGAAFVAHYYTLVEYGHITGKWQPLKQLTDESCKACRKFWAGPKLFKADEDVLTEVGTPNRRGIEDGRLEVTIVMDVGPGLSAADSDVEKIERTTKRWQDDVTVAYDDGWRVVGIEPDQLRPYEGCIANRCTDAQKERAKEGK